jgi:hypothetical protein
MHTVSSSPPPTNPRASSQDALDKHKSSDAIPIVQSFETLFFEGVLKFDAKVMKLLGVMIKEAETAANQRVKLEIGKLLDPAMAGAVNEAVEQDQELSP